MKLNIPGKLENYKNYMCVCLVVQSYVTLWDPMDCSPSSSFVHGDSSGWKTGVDCHDLLQGIFLTQELNPGLPYCRQSLYCVSHQVGLNELPFYSNIINSKTYEKQPAC